ncbi:prion-like-(Q N-rich) domain-bearing 25 [Brachionus plicatilis]|uniref:Prion-like-(Q N-rich) domain-bearing 25 n=1 Tax=Brachionus plicatilis TaxID=10195 RepID=A0A3M7P2J1_BRAPC|nr:prion-like-(Q N-rich) domain-bearing 25 [Brachionus plicatilis]
MYFPKYSPKKSKAALELEQLNNGKISIPKWIVVAGTILFIGLVAIFAASLAIALTAQPNGLYNQSCSSRSCENKLGLKCIEGTCLCPENHFYLDKCYTPSSLDGICRQDDHCKQDEFLVCGIGSKCSCSYDRYWNGKINRCSLRKTFNEACDGDECQSTFVCQSQICRCLDNERFYYDGNNCMPKKTYSQSCGVSSECLDSEKTRCQNSKYY